MGINDKRVTLLSQQPPHAELLDRKIKLHVLSANYECKAYFAGLASFSTPAFITNGELILFSPEWLLDFHSLSLSLSPSRSEYGLGCYFYYPLERYA